ncbi:MAG TPA: Nif3-like dinuclear metal center hexameric protein [Cyclobacteriaceae bacterium]|nr:Nif3-like dinuclear metal center hexameric protein [Cyclobacteriaceae bacterium]
MHRRRFINTMATMVGAAVVPAPAFAIPAQGRALTVQQVIDRIVAKIPGGTLSQTVDTLKAGRADQEVKGIVTTMFATVDVIKKCAELGANFIIAHEPTFYNHLDETDFLSDDAVYRYKANLLREHGIAVWRFHDYLHRHRPDGVYMGFLQRLGWEQHYVESSTVITLPETRLDEIIRHAKRSLGIHAVKVVGEPDQLCRRVAIMPGAWGGRPHLAVMKREKPDLLICGEVNEWETTEYVRDARAMGMQTSLIVLGHVLSEEPGMEWVAPWLKPIVGGINVTHVPSGDPYSSELG